MTPIPFSHSPHLHFCAAQGVIFTYAGTGTGSYSGDGGAASSGALNVPQGLAVDSTGNVYVADLGNNRVRFISRSTGIITTVAGTGSSGSSGDGGPATSAQLNSPYGVAVDASGNVFIADTANYKVRLVTMAAGIITIYAGTGTYGSSSDGLQP